MGKLVSASTRRSVWVLSTLAPLILVGFAAGANASPTYTVTDLGPGQPYAINNNGQVVGYNGANAFLYSGGSTTNIFQGAAYGINGAGVVAGDANGPAVTYDNGVTTTLPYLAGAEGNYASVAYTINSNAEVAGSSSTNAGTFHAVTWTGQTVKDLGTLGGSNSAAYGINDSGEVVGFADNASGVNEAFLYANNEMIDLGHGQANAINNSGQVVGLSTNVPSGAFLYSSGVMYDLGGSGNFIPLAINDSGTIVGNWGNGNGWAELDSNGNLVNLNSLISPTSGWVLDEATGINDNGQIIGWGSDGKGSPEAFLLTPISPLPEPGVIGIMAVVVLGTLARGRRTPHPCHKRVQPADLANASS
jgi:probable HAF family extracellular repeat protein